MKSGALQTAPRCPLEVEELLTSHQRRPFPDEIDPLAADPVLDHLPAARSGRDAYRLIAILDDLEKNRRCLA